MHRELSGVLHPHGAARQGMLCKDSGQDQTRRCRIAQVYSIMLRPLRYELAGDGRYRPRGVSPECRVKESRQLRDVFAILSESGFLGMAYLRHEPELFGTGQGAIHLQGTLER